MLVHVKVVGIMNVKVVCFLSFGCGPCTIGYSNCLWP